MVGFDQKSLKKSRLIRGNTSLMGPTPPNTCDA